MESVVEKPKVFAFESKYDKHNILVEIGGKNKEVQFEGHEFVTENEKTANALMAHPEFHKEPADRGFWLLEDVITGANKLRKQRYTVKSGSVGTV